MKNRIARKKVAEQFFRKDAEASLESKLDAEACLGEKRVQKKQEAVLNEAHIQKHISYTPPPPAKKYYMHIDKYVRCFVGV